MSEKTTPAKETTQKPISPAGVNGATEFIEKKTETALTRNLNTLKKKRRLTLDVTNIQKLGQIVCCTRSGLYTKELPSTFDPSGKALAYCVDITDVVTGDEFMLACNTVLRSAFMRAGEPLEGRYFAIRCGEQVAGKRYRRVDVVELEPAE